LLEFHFTEHGLLLVDHGASDSLVDILALALSETLDDVDQVICVIDFLYGLYGTLGQQGVQTRAHLLRLKFHGSPFKLCDLLNVKVMHRGNSRILDCSPNIEVVHLRVIC
jgi:hypothetical protein